ncbi:hypothetical protein Hanom_Chr11g00992951 [Helianthus anomalus]
MVFYTCIYTCIHGVLHMDPRSCSSYGVLKLHSSMVHITLHVFFSLYKYSNMILILKIKKNLLLWCNFFIKKLCIKSY